MEMPAFPRKCHDVTTCLQYPPKSRRFVRVLPREWQIAIYELWLFRWRPKDRDKRCDCSTNNLVWRDLHGLMDINCLPVSYETPAPPFPSTFVRPSTSLTAWSHGQSDVVCYFPTIIGVINAARENSMCARAKRVTRLQKRLWVRERDADAALIGGWERALFREVVDLFPLFFVRQRNRVHRVYRRDVIYDEHCLRTFIWFHKSFLRETSFLIGVYFRTVKKGIFYLTDILS